MDIDAVVFDIDGVLVTSWQEIPGAGRAVEAIRRAGLPVRFLTNTTSKSTSEIVEALRSCSITLDPAELITASIATGMFISEQFSDSTALVLDEGSDEDLIRFGISPVTDQPDVVIIGSGGPSITWDRLNSALRALQDGASLVAMNGGHIWRTSDGLCLDGGAFSDFLARESGVKAITIGKPSPRMFHAATDSMSVDPQRALMIGDDVVTDIDGAQRAGLLGALVRTGKFVETDSFPDGCTPDLILESVAALPAILEIE